MRPASRRPSITPKCAAWLIGHAVVIITIAFITDSDNEKRPASVGPSSAKRIGPNAWNTRKLLTAPIPTRHWKGHSSAIQRRIVNPSPLTK